MRKTINYYIYRHRRKDTGEVFYIGLGQGKRAFVKQGRSDFWSNIAFKGYDVEILAQNLSKEEAVELEIFLISIYGRRDLGTGCLVNMTDGGEGTTTLIYTDQLIEKRRNNFLSSRNPNYGKTGIKHHNFGKQRSEEVKLKISKSNSGKIRSVETKELLSSLKQGKYQNGNNPNSKKVIDIQTNTIYDSVKEASIGIGLNYNTVKAMLKGRNKNKTTLKYYINEA